MKNYKRVRTNPFEFLRVENLEIKQELNQHGILHIRGLIEDKNEEEYLRLLMEEQWLKAEAEDYEGDKQTLFHGIITSYTINRINHEKILELTCMSGTYLMDLRPHLRTFQNESKQYSTILNHISQGYKESGVIIGRQGDGEIQDMIIQYYETDWEFIKRLSSYRGCYINPECCLKGSKYFFGMPNFERYIVNDVPTYKVIRHLEDYHQKTDAGLSLFSADAVSYIFKSSDIFKIGDYISFQGKDLCIYRIKREYIKGECLHTYYLRTLNGLITTRVRSMELIGASLKAEVSAVKQDVVQVRVHEDENGMPDNTRWLPYSTVYSSEDGTGWYCMPEIGDEVRLQIPSANENEGYVASAVHLKSNTSRQNPEHKSLKNKYGKEILFTPDALIITNNDGLKIELRDKEGILINSDKEIRINSKGKLEITSENSTVIINGTDKVTLNQGDTNLIIDKDISFTGGDFRMQ